jgi:E3 ubiquitin-protein ligase RFWD2
VRPHLLSSDYEGCVTLWDAEARAAVNEYEAHDKRIWSIDFCAADPAAFVSGSDDGTIKARARCSAQWVALFSLCRAPWSPSAHTSRS